MCCEKALRQHPRGIMTAKNPHSNSSIRNQWAAQQVASRQGQGMPTSAPTPTFGTVPPALRAYESAKMPLCAQAGKEAEVVDSSAQASSAASPQPSSGRQVAETDAGQQGNKQQNAQSDYRPSAQAPKQTQTASAQSANAGTFSGQPAPMPINPMIAARMRQEAARKAAAGQPQPASPQRVQSQQQTQQMSPQARQYSRYETGRYVPGAAAASTGEYAPAEGIMPYALYGAACSLVSVLWCVWSKVSFGTSVMASHVHFTMGLVILAVILASGVAVGGVTAVLSRNKGNMSTSTAVALALGKTAIAMLISTIVWFVSMLIAA